MANTNWTPLELTAWEEYLLPPPHTAEVVEKELGGEVSKAGKSILIEMHAKALSIIAQEEPELLAA